MEISIYQKVAESKYESSVLDNAINQLEYNLSKFKNENNFQLQVDSVQNIRTSFWISVIGLSKTFAHLRESLNQLLNQIYEPYFNVLYSNLYLLIKNKVNSIVFNFLNRDLKLKDIKDINNIFSQFNLKFNHIDDKIRYILRERSNQKGKLKDFYDHVEFFHSNQNIEYRNIFIESLMKKIFEDDAEHHSTLTKLLDIISYCEKSEIFEVDNDLKSRIRYLIEINYGKFEDLEMKAILLKNANILEEDIEKRLLDVYMTKTKYKEKKECIQRIDSNGYVKDFSAFHTLNHELAVVNIYKGTYKSKQIVIKEYSKFKKLIFSIQIIDEAFSLQKFSGRENFLTFYGIDEKKLEDKQSYKISLIMDYCESDLKSYIQSLKKQSKTEATMEVFLYVADAISKAISEMHTEKIIHRDIKPDNIFIFQNQVKLADFSVSTIEEKSIGRSGTKGFRAPELNIKNSALDWYKTDVYSFGITLICLYKLITINEDSPDIHSKFKEEIKQIKDVYIRSLIERMIHDQFNQRPFIKAAQGYFTAIKSKHNIKTISSLPIVSTVSSNPDKKLEE